MSDERKPLRKHRVGDRVVCADTRDAGVVTRVSKNGHATARFEDPTIVGDHVCKAAVSK